MKLCKDCSKEFSSKRRTNICNHCKYLRQKVKTGVYCANCEKPATRPLCRACWILSQTGEKNSRFKGRYTNTDGYVLVKGNGHPNAQSNGWILEHILVMAEFLGRALLIEENVHHRNGVRNDNRLENLELWSKSQPAGQRVVDKIAWAKQLLSLYHDDESKL